MQADRETILASIHRYREEMKQEMSSVVDPAERKQLGQLRLDLAQVESDYAELAGQLAETEAEKAHLEMLLEVDLVPGLAALTARLAASVNRDSQLARLRSLLAAQEKKRGSLQVLAQDLANRERELTKDQRQLATQLEDVEAELKSMENVRKQRLEERARLAARESKLRRQLVEMERRYLDIGLVLPSSQIQDIRRSRLQKSLNKVNLQLKEMPGVNQKALIAFTMLCEQRDILGTTVQVTFFIVAKLKAVEFCVKGSYFFCFQTQSTRTATWRDAGRKLR